MSLLFGVVLLSSLPVLAGAQATPSPSASPAASPSAGLSDTCLTQPIEQKDRYLIGMSQANRGEPWRQAMNDQIAAAAAQHPNIEVVFADAAQNNAKQVADVETFLQQGIDLLIISPNEAAPLTDVVAKACAQGVPVIVLDRRVNGDQYTMWIGADNTEIGRLAGTYAATWCQEQGHNPCNIGEIRGLEGSTPAQERGNGFREGIAANPNATFVAQQNADWLRERAIPVSQSMFQANPDIHVLYAHNDPMAEAAIISAQNQGLDPNSILFVGIDGLPTADGGLQSVIQGRLDATYVYPTGGAEAIDWTVRILAGEQPPKEVVLETIEVTSDNAEAVLAEFGG
ncbi:MAG: substrate-binding domain-containing protein [Chloroflexia bacterium]|nr:substrate-binding domain-containing protein [Chloroflexia bacterium]